MGHPVPAPFLLISYVRGHPDANRGALIRPVLDTELHERFRTMSDRHVRETMDVLALLRDGGHALRTADGWEPAP